MLVLIEYFKTKRYLGFILLLIFPNISFSQSNSCTVKGTVLDSNQSHVLIAKYSEDFRNNNTAIIPVVGGKFEYVFSFEQNEPYQIVFKEHFDRRAFRPTIFFLQAGIVEITLFPYNEFDKNEVKGGNLNKDLSAYLKERDSVFFEPMMKLKTEQKAILNDPEAVKQLQLKVDSLKSSVYYYESNYIKTSSSIVAYYLLYTHAFKNGIFSAFPEDIQNNFQILSERFPNHPYTALIDQKFESANAIKVGGNFIDFTAPDLEGKSITFSDQLKDKITLLDLWGSWCGPCIRTSRTMIPVYQSYKEKGFNVIGVAREFKNTNALEKTLEREKFPWTNLLELDDNQHIWLKYGIPNSGGKTFLIDQHGKILAISPTAEELTKILEREL